MTDAPKVVLTKISVSRYRSCEKMNLDLDEKLSALVGINGSGKTTILNAVRLLRIDIAPHWRARYYTDRNADEQAHVEAWFSVMGKKIGLRLKVDIITPYEGNEEILVVEEKWKLPFDREFQKWTRVFQGQVRIGGLYRYFPLELATKRSPHFKRIAKYLAAINKFRSSISYYSASEFTAASKCATNFQIDASKKLEEAFNGESNFRPFLYKLYSLKENNRPLYNEFLSIISKDRLALVDDINFTSITLSSKKVRVKTGGRVENQNTTSTLIVPQISLGPSHLSFNQLSDGTFKAIALLFYIMTDNSSCLLIEEPEVCVHYDLLLKIIEVIKTYSSHKQIVFSTHSNVILNHLNADNVFVVKLVNYKTTVTPLKRFLGKKGTKALDLYLEQTGPLGEYWISGGLTT